MSSEPTTAEIRQYTLSLGFPIHPKGNLPEAAYARWNRDHPDRRVEVPEIFEGLRKRWRRYDWSRSD